MRLDVRLVDPLALPERWLDGYYRLVADGYPIDYPGFPVPSREAVIAALRSQPAGPDSSLWFGLLDDRPIGFARLDPLDGVNAEIVQVDFRVHPKFRRKGVGTGLIRAVSARLLESGRAKVLGVADEGTAGEAWALALGCEVTAANRFEQLDLSDTGATYRNIGPVAGFSLRDWEGEVPEELLDAFASARDAIHDRPKQGESYDLPQWTPEGVRAEERELRERGVVQRVVVAVDDETGAIAGLTMMQFVEFRPELGVQQDTAVVARYRGRGLGLAVKAAMLRLATAERPALTRIDTTVARTNPYMSGINRRLGFELVATMLVLEHGTEDLVSRVR